MRSVLLYGTLRAALLVFPQGLLRADESRVKARQGSECGTPLRSLAAVVVAALAALPFFGSDYVVGVGLNVLMWLALTQSWCVLSALTGYVSLGHAAFYGLGAYLVVITWEILPLSLAIPARRRARRRSSPLWSAYRCCACADRTS